MESLEENIIRAIKYEPSKEEEEIIEDIYRSFELDSYKAFVFDKLPDIRIPMEFVAKHTKARIWGEGEEAEKKAERVEGFNSEEMWKIVGRVRNFMTITNKSPMHLPRTSADLVVTIMELEPMPHNKAEIVLIPFASEIRRVGPGKREEVRVIKMFKALKRKVSSAKVEARIMIEGNKALALEAKSEKEEERYLENNLKKLAEVEIEEVNRKFSVSEHKGKSGVSGAKDTVGVEDDTFSYQELSYLEEKGKKLNYSNDHLDIVLALTKLDLEASSNETFRVSVFTDGKNRRVFETKIGEEREEKGVERDNVKAKAEYMEIKRKGFVYEQEKEEIAKQIATSREFLDMLKKAAKEGVHRVIEKAEKLARRKPENEKERTEWIERRYITEEEKQILKWILNTYLNLAERILDEKRVRESIQSSGALASYRDRYKPYSKEEVVLISISQVKNPQKGTRLLTDGIKIYAPDDKTNLISPETYLLDEHLCFKEKGGEEVRISRGVWRNVEELVLGKEKVREIDEIISKGGSLPLTYLAALLLMWNGTINRKNLEEIPEDLIYWDYLERISEAIEKAMYEKINLIKRSIGKGGNEDPWEGENIVPVVRLKEGMEVVINKNLVNPEKVGLSLEFEIQITEAGIKVDLGGGEFFRIVVPGQERRSNEIDLEAALRELKDNDLRENRVKYKINVWP